MYEELRKCIKEVNKDYIGYDVLHRMAYGSKEENAELMCDSMKIESISKNSDLYAVLDKYFEENNTDMEKCLRCFADDGCGNIYFAHGVGYDVVDMDLLGGDCSGSKHSDFDAFYEENFYNNKNALVLAKKEIAIGNIFQDVLGIDVNKNEIRKGFNNGYIDFEFWTDTAGQDCWFPLNFEAGNFESLSKDIKNCYEGYDLDDVVGNYLSSDLGGVPDAETLVEDCKECEEKLKALADAFEERNELFKEEMLGRDVKDTLEQSVDKVDRGSEKLSPTRNQER